MPPRDVSYDNADPSTHPRGGMIQSFAIERAPPDVATSAVMSSAAGARSGSAYAVADVRIDTKPMAAVLIPDRTRLRAKSSRCRLASPITRDALDSRNRLA